MRGRTNITQRTAPYVNGNVIQAIVDVGNTISAGDFVEYKERTATEDAGFSGDGLQRLHNTAFLNNYVLCKTNNNFEIWSNVTKNKISSISSVNCFCVMPDNKIIAMNGNNIYCIAFENNSFVIKDTKSFSDTSFSGIKFGIAKVDSTHFVLLATTYNQSSKLNVIVFGYDDGVIGDIEKITLEVTTLNSFQVSGSQQVYSLPDDMYVCYLIDGTSGGGKYGIVNFNSSYEANSVQSVNASISKFKTRISENVFIVSEALSSSNAKAYYYDSTNKQLNTYSFSFPFSIYDSYTCISSNDKENFCVLSDERNTSSKIIYIVYFDEVLKQVYISNVLNFGTFNNSNNFKARIVLGSIEDFCIYNLTSSNNKKINLAYSVSDNELSTGANKTYVKNYTGGKAIGFAKTSGVAGDIIYIYTPIIV